MKRKLFFVTLMMLFCSTMFGQDYHYGAVVNNGEYDTPMTITAVISFDGNEQMTDKLEVGVFCNGEIRGRVYTTKIASRYYARIPVFGEAGDAFVFKVYDHRNDIEWTYGCKITCDGKEYTSLSYRADGYGLLLSPAVVNFTTPNHWMPDEYEYIDSFTITAVVEIDGEEQSNPKLELGAFCETEIRGSVKTDYTYTHNNVTRYYARMTIFGNKNDVITFKLYDHETKQELQFVEVNTITFEYDNYGLILEPLEINFITKQYVAQVGDVKYTSLQEAITAAQSGNTITLLADVELTETVTVEDKSITLDLDDYDIIDECTGVYTANNDVWGLIELDNAAKLTVIGSGTIICNYEVVTAGWTGMAYCINVDETSELIVEGGSFINGNGGIQTRGKLTVNDGTFVSHNGGTCIMALYSDANVTVNGGSFSDSVEEGNTYTGSGAVWGGFGATIAITGGTFDFEADPSNNNIVWTLFPAQNAILGYGSNANANMTVTGGTFTNFNPETDVVIDYSQSEGFKFGSVVADRYAALKDLNGNYVVGEKPTATVNNLGAMTIAENDYIVYNGSVDGDMPLSFVMQFLADQDAEDMETSPFADWYADFVLTFTGLEEGSFTADGCYLAGYYGDFGWVKVPVDGMTIENGVRYPVMLGVDMGQKYYYICETVKDFRCALYLTDEILEANPNLAVNLELSIVDNSKGEYEALGALASTTHEYIYQVASIDYAAEDFAPAVAKIGDTEYKTLQAAINAATEGQTITLLANVTISESIVIEKSVIIEAGEYTITNAASGYMIKVNAASALTINGGVFNIPETNTASTGFVSLQVTGSDLNVNGGIYTGNTTTSNGSAFFTNYKNDDFGAYNNEFVLNAVTATSNHRILFTHESADLVRVTGGTYIGAKECFYASTTTQEDRTTIFFENVTAKSTRGPVVELGGYLGGCVAEFTGCDFAITGTDTDNDLSAAIGLGYGAKAIINSGTYAGVTTAPKGNVALSIYSTGGEFVVEDGTFNGGVYVYAYESSYGGYGVTINGGTFTDCFIKHEGSAPCDFAISGGRFTGDFTADVTRFITGGVFSSDVTEFCAENYGAVLNMIGQGEEVWIVRQTSGSQSYTYEDPGWYWFSSYININGEEALDTIQRQIGSKGDQIKGTEGFTDYYPFYNAWTSGLTSLSSDKMYMIKTVGDNVTFELQGDFVEYENLEIVLNPGWNWISFPLNEEVHVSTVLSNLNPSNGDIFKTKDGTAIYRAGSGKWLPDPMTIPGAGYMYKSGAGTQTRFTYNVLDNDKSRESESFNVDTSENHWNVDIRRYPSNMTMVVNLFIDGEPVKGNYEIAAFANGECRGSERPIYIEDIDSYVWIMTIQGDEATELTFKCYDIEYGTEYELDNRVIYSTDAILGTIDEPYMLNLNILDIDEPSLDEINIYPNPTTIGKEINLYANCEKVEVFNTLGVKIAEYHNVDSVDAFETAGIYVIRMTNKDEIKHCRLVVR